MRNVDGGHAARSRLFKALHAANLRTRRGDPLHRMGAPVDTTVGINLLTALYRRGREAITTVGVVRALPDDGLLRLVDNSILVADRGPHESMSAVEWAEAIVDRVRELGGSDTTSRLAAGA